ncbi:sugar ABC transporter permease [Nesterenkonia sp. MY13]|uniref:Sugar ABC transporter permease n=1 Tax=Nesterenkonia sedimenti TaxID=1463632 RepID=A0A7X8TL43_9MICC|nr:sugar ABC transporter permease [Nesterenkonia sedimenti]NLS10576.1 sugar ABC transporter permease [Nesterenkonia sedimenti]
MTTTAENPANAEDRRRRDRRPARPKKSDRAKAEARLGWMLAGPAFVVMLAVTAYPIAQAIFDSLFSYRLTAPDERSFIFLDNYLLLFTDGTFWRIFGVTLLITVITVAVELVLGFGLAIVMHKALKSLRGLLRTSILVPYGIITVVSAFAWYYMFHINSGFVNQWFSWVPGIDSDLDWFANFWTAITVIMASEIWKTTPFIALLLLAGLAQVPDELVEAARVDGATRWQQYSRVIIPNMKAAIMVALLFRALDAFRIFDNVFIMTGGDANTEVLALLAYRQSISRLEIGLGSAVSVVLFISVLLMVFVAIKLFKVDLASGTDASGGGKKKKATRKEGQS